MTYNSEIDTVLRNWLDNFPRSYFKKIKAKENRRIYDYVLECTPLLSGYNISTRAYWTIHHITEFPRCKICGKELKQDIKATEGYPTYCSQKCVMNDPEVKEHIIEKCQLMYGKGITNQFQAESIKKKIVETNLRKYGVSSFTKTQEYRDIVHDKLPETELKKRETHKMNNSFHTSRIENIVFDIIKRVYPNVIHGYTSSEYKYDIDFYIPDTKTYIDFNGSWTHGGHPFNPENNEDITTLNGWKNKNTEYYDNAVYTWTDLDVRKRTEAENNNINRIELWSIGEVYRFLYGNLELRKMKDLIIEFDRKTAYNEMQHFKNYRKVEKLPGVGYQNYIIKYFQQDTFFKHEKELWHDEKTRNKLIDNRMKYLGKTEDQLTVMDLLAGFKKSCIYYGYSHFNPLWFKYFIDKYDVKICYDPCGGWGHRLLGGLNLEKYIYNDLSRSTKENVDRMIDYFKITNATTYNNDASSFIPEENFEAMFTCPPYYNLEHYECGDFRDINEYNNFIDRLFDVYKSRNDCRIFGLVIREDLLIGHEDYEDKIPVKVMKAKHLVKSKNHSEFMYIYRKNLT